LPIIEDSKKALTLQVGEKKKVKTSIVTNGNGFSQEKIFDQIQLYMNK
ncbi:18415_t:CDS:1, partial [Gigaspora margarita]